MIAPNPYAGDLGDRDAVRSLRETPDRYLALLGSWTPDQFERTYAPGKRGDLLFPVAGNVEAGSWQLAAGRY